MGMERDLAHDLLAKVRRQGATEADLLIVETDSSTTQVRLRDIESLKSAQERRLHLRVMFDKSSAATSTSDFSIAGPRPPHRRILHPGRATAADAYLGLPNPESIVASMPDLALFDDEAQDLDVEEKIALVKAG